MKTLLAWFMTAAVAFVLGTVLAFAGVYFTTILFVVTVVEIITYYATQHTIKLLTEE
ncbi:hypothetical protein [Staphylococcus coagulans]|uniref:hypothetical protein n=1 Tax=Staphylococcus coagulans TaxID=74706 RepID=UPI000A7A3EC7